MKLERTEASVAAAAREARPFREVLERAAPTAVRAAPGASRTGPAARPAPVQAAAAARTAPASTASPLPRPPPAAGAEGPQEDAGGEPRTRRLLELVTQELAAGPSREGSVAANDVPFQVPGAPPPVDDPRQQHLERSAAAAALIEKIQVFVRYGQRPVLALTLHGSLGARAEIERLGPGRVAVTLVGHRGPPCPEAVSRIRDELLARGLKVAAISVS